ncbi:MAG TPA: O-antigen ligase family protein [Stellaceae bacterium]|nr:O-antigen ligase family protein [Stellaceae bacterium]
MQAAFRARSAFELGLDACAFLFLPVLALASRGAAPLVAVAGALALGLVAPDGIAAWRRLRGLALLFAALLLWGLISALWAVDPGRSLLTAARLAGLFAAGLSLMAAAERIAAPRRLLACLIAGLAVAVVLTVLQFATGGELTGPFRIRPFKDPLLNQVENGFVLLLLPLAATLVLRRRFVAAGLAAAATATVIYLLVGTAAQAAFVVGIGAALPIYFKRRWFARAAAVASVLLVLSAPLIFPSLIDVPAVQRRAADYKQSMQHRLQIWSFVGTRIAERPLSGWGLDSSRAIPGGKGLTPEGKMLLPLHPHNVALQAWLELGVPGAVLLALFIARLWLAFGAAAWPRLFATAAGGSLVAALTVALGSYGIWQEWWIGTEFLSLFLILVMARLAAEKTPDDSRA